MILILGGAYQGKRELAASLGIARERILPNAHLVIRELMKKGGDTKAEFERLLDGIDAVTCDEIGMGIVPADKPERDWRECTGRIMCDLAARADTVYRVVCGIPMLIAARRSGKEE